MAAPPLRTALSDTYPSPSNATMRTGMGALWDYVTTLLGASGTAADARTALGAVALSGGTLTGALNFATAATVASATTTDIGAAASNVVTVTGTTTITGLGTIASGALRAVTFSGALTLTHNATSLILPGAANITTAAGDNAIFISLGSGNWRCLAYQRANGGSVVSASVSSATTTAEGIVELATDAEAIAGTDAVRAITPASMKAGLNASGSAPTFAARAFLCFNGTGTPAILGSGNIAGITDLGAGAYEANFITAMPDANYTIAGACGNPDAGRAILSYGTNNGGAAAVEGSTKTTTKCAFFTTISTSLTDFPSVSITFFR